MLHTLTNFRFVVIVMVALWSRADHYIFALWFLVMAALCNRGPLYFCPVISIYRLLFFHLISAATDWMSTILLHMAWP